jgi:hypothetical protein
LLYKLFSNRLDELVNDQKLVRLPLVFDPDQSERRELFMPPALRTTLEQRSPKKAMDYNANIKGYLGRYVKGDWIDNQDYMKNWPPTDAWELRVQNQRKGERLRIFGAFGRPDTFIAFFRKDRSWFDTDSDVRWEWAMNEVGGLWESTFPGCPMMKARPFSNCVTFNATDVGSL